MINCRRQRLFLTLGYLVMVAAPARALDEIIDSPMYANPNLPVPRRVKVFHKGLLPLWLRALDRPEADLQRLAATSIAQAHVRGMPGLETAIPPLLKALDRPDLHPTARAAVAHALVALDARQAAGRLLALAQSGGPRLRNMIEPALARWDYAPARAMWLERLDGLRNDEPAPSISGGVLAVRALGTVREPRAVPRLRELALEATTGPVLRLEAARALGAVQTAGAEKDAARLAEQKVGESHLVAALLLRQHGSPVALQVLERLALEASEPAAAACALERLVEVEPRRVVTHVRRVVASRDADVRAHGIKALGMARSAEHVSLLADLLDDPHPQVRVLARKTLREWARAADFDSTVRREATRVLATSRWRALEQATILLAVLGHKPAAPRFVELLRFERPEVFVAAAWGLRKLALPEMLPEMARVIEWQLPRFEDPVNRAQFRMIDLQVAQLAQALGKERYRPADALLRRFIPKNLSIGQEARAAAIWALGLIHEGRPPDPALASELIERLPTPSPFEPSEDMRVRRMSAVALGFMKERAATGILRSYYGGSITEEEFNNACGWALHRITGAALPPPGTIPVPQQGWFLEPID
jgi:HEAT repeat protein